jgi:fatty acid desaturase
VFSLAPSRHRTFESNGLPNSQNQKGSTMLWTLFIFLLVLWLLGLVSNYTLGGFVHVLLVLAVVALIFQLLFSRRDLGA